MESKPWGAEKQVRTLSVWIPVTSLVLQPPFPWKKQSCPYLEINKTSQTSRVALALKILNVPGTRNTCGSWQKTEIASLSDPVSWPCGVMDVWHSVCDRVKAPGNEDGKLGLSVRSLVPYQRDELTLNQWRNVNRRVSHKDVRVRVHSHVICSLIISKYCLLQLTDWRNASWG